MYLNTEFSFIINFSVIFRAKSTFQGFARDSVESYFHSVSLTTDAQRKKLFSKQLKDDIKGYNAVQVFHQHAQQAPTKDALSLIQYIDMKTYKIIPLLGEICIL